jgi:membrane protein DedA with SNARE-associated domain
MSATDSLQFLEHYGVFILPALAVAEQLGIPLPAVPALLAVGALAADGRISIPLVLGAMSVAALVTDFAWYELGRRRGAWLLARFRRMSPEPDTCVRRAESIFGRHGARGMLAAKFLPGLTTLMPPLAGVFGSRECVSLSMTSRACSSGRARGWRWDTASATPSSSSPPGSPSWDACSASFS